MELEDFLVMAKKSTSGSEETEPIQLDDGSKEYRFEAEDYVFRDRFFGGNPFIGQEVVYWKGDPIWSMNYYGKVTSRTPEEVFKFLTKVLAAVEKKKPYRGPERFSEGLWEYRFMSRGNVYSFWGEEETMQNGIKVQWLRFHGGEIGEQPINTIGV